MDKLSTVRSEQGVIVKLFAGFHATSELKMHLAQSRLWKENLIFASNRSGTLELIHFQEKDYLGKYLTQSFLSLKDLPSIEAELKQELLKFCPKFKQEKLMVRLFSQTFIL